MTDNDRRIHEQIEGKCWHEGITWDDEGFGTCPKCNLSDIVEHGATFTNPSYLSWEHYGPMIQKLMKDRKRWIEFTNQWWFKDEGYILQSALDILLDPERGCEAIVNFFCKEK